LFSSFDVVAGSFDARLPSHRGSAMGCLLSVHDLFGQHMMVYSSEAVGARRPIYKAERCKAAHVAARARYT
jgi:hypothetical protein